MIDGENFSNTVNILIQIENKDMENVIRESLTRLSRIMGISILENTNEKQDAGINDHIFDVMIMDERFLKQGDANLLRDVRRTSPLGPKLVVVGGDNDPRAIIESFKDGVRGWITSTADPDVFLGALYLVLVGSFYVPIKAILHPSDMERQVGSGQRRERIDSLTARQKAVLAGIARGRSNREIGQRLGVTEGTIKLHVHAILRALGVSNRTEAALIAREADLSELDSENGGGVPD